MVPFAAPTILGLRKQRELRLVAQHSPTTQRLQCVSFES
jgi:hypothetical protein